MKEAAEIMTIFTSFLGIYLLLSEAWTEAEIAELGHATVTKADTFVCVVLTVIVCAVLTFIRWRCE